MLTKDIYAHAYTNISTYSTCSTSSTSSTRLGPTGTDSDHLPEKHYLRLQLNIMGV